MILYSCYYFLTSNERLRKLLLFIPFRIIVLIFILWANSSYAPAVKNVGFYCEDESIKRPYHGDSVHFSILFTVLLVVFPLIVYLTEVLIYTTKSEEGYSKYPTHLLLRNYYSGFLFTLCFTEVLKLSVCELRPHFFTSCLPDMSNIECSEGYITQFNCTGKGQSSFLGRDIYKSFPSGHASLSVFSFVFFNIYLFSRVRKIPLSTHTLWYWWSYSIPVITFLWTLICCISRIMDNRHFWWDVLVGILIGIVAGFITVRSSLQTVLRLRTSPNIPKND